MILPLLARIVSYLPWFDSKKPRPLVEPPHPLPQIVDDRLAQGVMTTVLRAVASLFSCFPWSPPKKQEPPPEPHAPLPHIVEEFLDYIRNHIPARLIDTTSLKFVDRDDVYDIFYSEIAQITHQDVQKWMPADTDPATTIYIPAYKTALQKTIHEVVRYAIFSHRWTLSEPSYRDVSQSGIPTSIGRRRRSAGLFKLARLCETARALGYRLVWSDTCCIDRTNTAELSEAIHAMFKWYVHAHVCIVHLGASSSSSDFEHEPWFKRGWTLQELLAPQRIKFYNKDWDPFTELANDKEDEALLAKLSSVTGIPREVVIADNTRGIKGRGIWEIMSWAAPRKTMRIEDRAYSLFGLFGVHPPIAYGEGEKAFPRLVEAIIARRPTAWDVFVWAGQASEGHPTLPNAPACYPPWDETVVSDDVGMTSFTLTSHGLRLTSVSLVPMVFVSARVRARAREGVRSYVVTLRPGPGTATLGVFGDVTVVCGSNRLEHIRHADDLHVCILNYKPIQNQRRGQLQVGRTYVCFLLHMRRQSAGGPAWLKFTTDNVLRMVCKGPAAGAEHTSDGLFDLPLSTTRIRPPRSDSTTR